MKVEVYQDLQFEENMKKYLERGRDLVQGVYDQWLKIGFPELLSQSELYEIIHAPDIPYQEQCNKLKLPAPGIDEELAKEHAESIKLPDPEAFFNASREARANVYSKRDLSLFEPRGKKVILSNKTGSIIKSRSVYATTDRQKDFFTKLDALVKNLNDLNDSVSGRLLVDNNRKLGGVFKTPARDLEGFNEVSIEPSNLQELMKFVK